MASEPSGPPVQPDLRFLIHRGPQRFRRRSAGLPQTLTRTLRLEAGNWPAERKEWAMSTHVIRTSGRFRLAAVGISLAIALPASVLAIQGHSIWSTATHPVVRPASFQVDPYPYHNRLRSSDLRPHGGSRALFNEIPMSQLRGEEVGLSAGSSRPAQAHGKDETR